MTSFAEAMQQTVRTLVPELPGSVVWIGHLDGERGVLRVVAADGEASFGLESGLEVPLESSFCYTLASGAGCPLANDVPGHRAYGALPAATGRSVGSFAGVALRLRDGSAVGTLCAFHRAQGAYAQRDLELLQAFGTLLSRDFDNQQRSADLQEVVADLRRQAFTDALTGVANRRALVAALGRAFARRRRSTAVALVDVDRFKEVNDRHGHLIGDAVLCAVAQALRQAGGRRDTVGRLGGDEFAVVLAADDVAAWRAKVDFLVDRVADEFGVAIAVSAGVARLDEAASPDDALALADSRLYAAKRALVAA